jgi:hypothetical protein
MGYDAGMCNGHDHQNEEQDMKTQDLLPGEEDFDVLLSDPDFQRLSFEDRKSQYSKDTAAAMARADAPQGRGGAQNTGTAATGASDKQRSYLTSLAAERGLEVKAAWLASKAAASKAIDDLLALPKAARGNPNVTSYEARTGAPATDKQKAFVRTLLAERAGNPDAEVIRTRLNELREVAPMTAADVSAAITALLEIPKSAAAEVEAGVYVLANGNLARVYFGQQSGHMLLKEVVDGDLEYRGQAHRFLAGSRKATIEEVGNWGRATGTCLVCSRRLDDPESVDRGIGPVCYAKMGGD